MGFRIVAERLSFGDGERKTPLTRQTVLSRCHQRFVRPRLADGLIYCAHAVSEAVGV